MEGVGEGLKVTSYPCDRDVPTLKLMEAPVWLQPELALKCRSEGVRQSVVECHALGLHLVLMQNRTRLKA